MRLNAAIPSMRPLAALPMGRSDKCVLNRRGTVPAMNDKRGFTSYD